MPDAKAVYGIKFTSATEGDKYLAFRAPKELYDGLATSLGLDALTTPAQLSKAVIVEAAAYCNRLRITYKKGTETRTGSLWCAPSKFQLILKDPPTKYRTYDVVSAGQPLDSSRS